jgi:NitT/TauT family transport system substrate-binding protein
MPGNLPAPLIGAAAMLRRVLATIVLAASLGAGAAGQGNQPVVRVATIPVDSGAEGYYAQDLGFFKKAGLNVELASVQNGNEMIAAAVSGTYDIVNISTMAAALAHDRGIPLVLIAPAVLWSGKAPTSSLVVGADSPIRTARDLNGKTIALNALANIPGVAVQAWMDQNGGDSASVKFIELPWPAMQAAIAAQRVDAGFLAEPYLDAARKTGTVRVVAAPYSAVAGEFLLAGWFSSAEFAKGHPDVVRRFAAAVAETAAWANRNHAESGRILEKYTKTAVSPTLQRVVYAERSDPLLVQPVIDASVRYKLLRTTFPARDIFAASQLGS